MYIIYLHTCLLSGKSYVGFTSTSLEKRWKKHVTRAKAGSESHFPRAIRKYGENSWLHSILTTCETFEEARNLEMYWIAELMTTNFHEEHRGYNSTDGGNGARAPMSIETKRKMSDSHSSMSSKRPIRISEETREKNRIATLAWWAKQREGGWR